MSPTISTFLVELANFLVLAGAIGWLLFRPVRTALETRRRAEAERAKDLDLREAAVVGARSDLEAAKKAFEDDSARVRTERLDAADVEAKAIVAHARERAEREVRRTQELLGQLDRDQLEHLATAVAAASRDAVEKLLTSLGGSQIDQALVEATCRELAADAGPFGPVLVESAAVVDDASRRAVATAIGARATSIDFRVVPELGAGLRVTTSHGLIDASAKGLAAGAERVISERLVLDSVESRTDA